MLKTEDNNSLITPRTARAISSAAQGLQSLVAGKLEQKAYNLSANADALQKDELLEAFTLNTLSRGYVQAHELAELRAAQGASGLRTDRGSSVHQQLSLDALYLLESGIEATNLNNNLNAIDRTIKYKRYQGELSKFQGKAGFVTGLLGTALTLAGGL